MVQQHHARARLRSEFERQWNEKREGLGSAHDPGDLTADLRASCEPASTTRRTPRRQTDVTAFTSVSVPVPPPVVAVAAYDSCPPLSPPCLPAPHLAGRPAGRTDGLPQTIRVALHASCARAAAARTGRLRGPATTTSLPKSSFRTAGRTGVRIRNWNFS